IRPDEKYLFIDLMSLARSRTSPSFRLSTAISLSVWWLKIRFFTALYASYEPWKSIWASDRLVITEIWVLNSITLQSWWSDTSITAIAPSFSRETKEQTGKPMLPIRYAGFKAFLSNSYIRVVVVV